ncbi:MAG: hypothetical protein ACHQF3_16160 [Alphaproteobacteria bacterium]
MALALASCAAPPAPERPVAAAAPPAEPPQAVHPPTPPGVNQEAALPPLPVPPPRERPVDRIMPERLVGLSEADIRALIGEPGAVREEPPAVVWSYASAGCGLELSFYMDLASQTFRALTYELKPKAPHGLTGSTCLTSLRPAPP